MSYDQQEPFSKQLTIIIGLTVVGFMAFGLALSFYRNVLFDQLLSTLSEQNNTLRQQIDNGYRELEYYKSHQYKDKYAKENLRKINEGEKVLVITQKKTDSFIYDNEEIQLNDQQEAAYLELLRQMPIVQHWQLYLFHRDRADELKRSFFGDA